MWWKRQIVSKKSHEKGWAQLEKYIINNTFTSFCKTHCHPTGYWPQSVALLLHTLPQLDRKVREKVLDSYSYLGWLFPLHPPKYHELEWIQSPLMGWKHKGTLGFLQGLRHSLVFGPSPPSLIWRRKASKFPHLKFKSRTLPKVGHHHLGENN